ncbi:MAG: hypothetical protein ACI4QY_06300 [Oscillospiraceae bacterium]
MSDNVIFLITAIPVPIIMLIVGITIWKNPPSPGSVGYKSKYARSSPEAWFFAQITWGKLSVFHNIPTLIGTIIAEVTGILLRLDENQGLMLYIVVTTAQVVVIFTDIFITEHRLKKNYNADGTHK